MLSYESVKQYVDNKIPGGFDSRKMPVRLYDAINNSEKLEEVVIGTIDFNSDEYLDESKIGDVNLGSSKGTCTVKVLMREGINYPHFHIESTKGPDESVCIAIYRAEYYKHSHGEATLNSKEIKILNKWLDSKYKKKIPLMIDGNVEMVDFTNWQFIALNYDQSNGTNYFNREIKRPDYTANMPDMKDAKQ